MNPLNNLSAYVRQIETKMNKLAAEISAVRVQGAVPVSLPGQYDGKPISFVTAGAEIVFPANSTNAQRVNIRIEPDGPFQARAIHFAARCSASNDPWLNQGQLAMASCDVHGIDFYWEYMVSGSRRNRQNIPVPSALVWRGEEGNGYFDFLVPEIFEPSSTITVTITPVVAFSSVVDVPMFVGFSGDYMMRA